MPFGISEDGLPIGVQIAARTWRDHVAITAAIMLETSAANRWRGHFPVEGDFPVKGEEAP